MHVSVLGQNTMLATCSAMQYILLKALPRVCMENTARGGVSREIQHEAKPSAVFISRHVPECCIFGTNEQRQYFRWYIVL